MAFNPPPNWPPPPAGWSPPPGWRPDPAWGPPPDGWQLWTDDPPSETSVGAASDGSASDGSAQAEPAREPRDVRTFARNVAFAAVGLFLLIIVVFALIGD